jgi:prepilin-type N-terminal cleavage/methylation domain-containing protein
MRTSSDRRPGVTLLEVLVAIFIMGIGMLALLTLFPVGAVSMGRALRDDRCATCAANADAIGWAQSIRNDPLIFSNSNYNPSYNFYLGGTNTGGFTAVNTMLTGPSYGVYVDPQGVASGVYPKSIGAFGTTTTGIPRVSISLQNYTSRNPVPPALPSNLNVNEATRWCSLLDDVLFLTDGTPDQSTGSVQRYGAYTWAWLMRETQATPTTNITNISPPIDCFVIVYRGRDTTTFNGETTYPATGNIYDTAVTVVATGLPLRTGTWVLDTTPYTSGGVPTGAVPGYFYRIVDYTENTANGHTILQLDRPIMTNLSVITIMENVAEVFYRGKSPQ